MATYVLIKLRKDEKRAQEVGAQIKSSGASTIGETQRSLARNEKIQRSRQALKPP